jgi:hypothetical protein
MEYRAGGTRQNRSKAVSDLDREDRNLPMIPESDGFDDREHDGRIIKGVLLKCNDGRWPGRDGLPAPTGPLLVIGTLTILQRWSGKKPIETIIKEKGKDWPDVDILNEVIPQSEWEIGIDGQPRPPWQVQRVVYLVDENSAERYTYANGTVGAHIAVSELKDRLADKRFMLVDDTVLPVVELSSKPMKTRYGVKMRPEFRVVGWRSTGGTPRLEPPPTEKVLQDKVPY